MTDLTTTTDPSQGVSDRVVALLRTAVPSLWGTLVAWLLTHSAAQLSDASRTTIGGWLSSPAAVAIVVSAAIAAWYALWHWLTPKLPAWLVRLVLGSSRTPTYAPVTNDGAQVITDVAARDTTPALSGEPAATSTG